MFCFSVGMHVFLVYLVCLSNPDLHFLNPNLQVVSSRQWPLISKYRASVRTQSPKVEMIDSLFKPVSDKEDEGIMRLMFLVSNLIKFIKDSVENMI